MNTPNLSPTTLAQYIRLENCDRFLRFRLVPEDAVRLQRRWKLAIQPLTPLLRESGAEFEGDVAAQLAGSGEAVIDLTGRDFSETLHALQSIEKPAILFQAALEGRLGSYPFAGRADILRLRRDRKGRLQVLVADIKATRQEKTEHRLQVAAYAYLVRALSTEHGIPLGRLSGAVITRSDGGYSPLSADTPTFDLETYFGIINRLALADDSTVRRVLDAPFEAAFFHLGPKCDGCLFNALCMYDAAERLDLALTPEISPVEKRILLDAGVESLPELAGLMALPAPEESEMQPAAEHQETLEALKNRWPLAANLPLLTQRAKAALRHFDPRTEYRPFLYGAGFGSLPSEALYPGLVKVFFDVQRDYLQDRLYLLAACVAGPHARETVVELAGEPPDDAAEAQLLQRWILRVFAAVQYLAGSDEAPIHFYCYSRYDQKTLLEALKRSLPMLAAFPVVYDLLTQNPALSQPLVSFLADELRERANPGRVCLPLHDAARWRGFDWKDERYEYYRLFHARMFDNRREVVRRADGRLAPASASAGEAERTSIEAASRFGSQIPLEYAYAAWGRLPEDAEDPRLLEPFRAVSADMLRTFAGRRVEALAQIEASFRNKSKTVEKAPLRLPQVFEKESAAGAPASFQRSLKEFLFMEHHTRLQGLLASFRLPVERRVQSGEALLLVFNHGADGGRCVFTPDFESLGLDPEISLNACKLKEGDWVVLNPLHPAPAPGQLKHGRLAVIESLDEACVTLQLLGLSFQSGYFRYSHDFRLEPRTGLRYTIDPMGDDINADKVVDALDHAESNVFFDWLLEKPGVAVDLDAAFMQKFGDYVADLIRPRGRELTGRQREVISAQGAYPLVLVQGPPGTGKSYTLAWAILAWIAAAAVRGRPCRVLVACKTHNAIQVVLQALAAAQSQVGVFAPSQLGGQGIFSAEIYKVLSEAGEALPEFVRPLRPYEQRLGLANLLARRFLVIGATPGGAYNLARYRLPDVKEIDWEQKIFDMVVIDEASQMSLPEGVLAGAFLKPGGRMIIVGDHRQMPPIIAHDWKNEPNRQAASDRPFVSLFEALIDRQFPLVGLDESFRLHHQIAEFLRENVYARDGIRFHSKRRELLPRMPSLSDYADVALDPQYPIVVIEHSESASQQYNLTELELVRPLIDACVRHLGLDGRSGVGVVVPHRTQKALLRKEFPALAEANSIDTVERFQGDERDLIIVSATASDPDYVRGEAGFLLNLNRLNVAISRPRKKLIVVAARTVIDLLTSDIDVFEQSLIWKRLYHHYTPDVLLTTSLNGHAVIVRGRRAQAR